MHHEHQYVQYPYRYMITFIFVLCSFMIGIAWTVVTPISLTIAKVYHQPPSLIVLVPMTFMITYILFTFPSNWTVDVHGIRTSVTLGIILTAIGTGIRSLVNVNFVFLFVGQILCGIGQPFMLNATTKTAD